MGNHHSHDSKDGEGFGIRGGSRRSSSIKSASKEEPEVKVPQMKPVSLVPIEKLAKMLVQHSHKEEGVKDGITENTFVKYVFPSFPSLGGRVFSYLRRDAAKLSASQFSHNCELLLSLLDDVQIIDAYVRMFSSIEEGSMSRSEFLMLLATVHQVSQGGDEQNDEIFDVVSRTLEYAVQGCFSSASTLKVGCVVRWLTQHLRRILLLLHRFVLSSISSGYRQSPPLAVAVVRGPPPAGAGFPESAAFLTASAAPKVYSAPSKEVKAARGGLWAGTLGPRPAIWTPLYQSSEHGLGANRFLHHTLAYRGPTVVVVTAGSIQLCVLAPREWKDSASYWGNEHAGLIQTRPVFQVIVIGGKILYLSTLARGLPKGLRVAEDPRSPILDVNQDFDTLSFGGETYPLDNIEVWGCGDQASREAQLDIKKWQVQECERQRQVKLSPADWLEHPDRYLLQLAGRAQYNNSAS